MRNGIIDRFCPENTWALYEKLVQTSGIRGDISLRQENGNEYILWRVSDALEITAYVEADFGEGYIGIEKYAMHWHPEIGQIYTDLKDIGGEGCIMVVRKTAGGMQTLYMGPKDGYEEAKYNRWYLRKPIVLE